MNHVCNTCTILKQQLAAANARIAELEATLNETYTDDFGTVWTRPTAWAYAAVCKVLNSDSEGQIPCAVAHCKLFKTYAEYNHKVVEAQIAEYGRTHE